MRSTERALGRITTSARSGCGVVAISGEWRWPSNEGDDRGLSDTEELAGSGRGPEPRWERAAKFTSVDALERFVAKHAIEVFGIF